MKTLAPIMKRFSFSLCADHRRWLESNAGQQTHAADALPDPDSIWKRPGQGQVYSEASFRHVASIYGVRDLKKRIADAKGGSMRFWHTAYLRYGLPVGVTYGGDPIVQIVSGAHQGEIYIANHECWYGFPSDFAAGKLRDDDADEVEDLLEELGIDSLDEPLDPDAWVALMSNESLDFMWKVADSFEAFFRRTAEEHASSGFEIDADACWDALCVEELPERSLDLVGWFIDQVREDSAFLWVDEPWADLEYEDLETRMPLGLAVFTEPVEVEGPLVLSAEHLVGDTSMRDARAFVFLSEVRCDSLVTLADTVAVFAGGLVATNASCFSAPDAETHVGSHFESKFVVSGGGDGAVNFWPETRVSIDVLDGAIGGTAQAADVLSFGAKTIEEEDVGALVYYLATGRKKVPKGYRFPTRAKRRAGRKSKEAPERLSPDDFLTLVQAHASDEVQRLVSGNQSGLFRESEDYALRVPNLAALNAFVQGEERAPVAVVVTGPVNTKETIELEDLTRADRTFAYVFLEDVHCLDLNVGYEVLATFGGGLNARIVSTAKSDCHLHVEGHVECAVQSGSLYITPHTRLAVGAWTGWTSGRGWSVGDAFPHLAEDFEDDHVSTVLAGEDSLVPRLPTTSSAFAGGVAGKSFCVTGTFDVKRSVIHTRIEAAGGEVHKSVRASTDYLVAGAKTGAAKRAAAKKHGVTVLDAAGFDALF
ncbi:MAG: BRCT domain-containing protein [Myxococcota bacterium]